MPKTLIDKIWDRHFVTQEAGAPAILYIDLHLIHEVTSPQAFQNLRERGLKVYRPDRTFGTIDHSVPTLNGPQGRMAFADPQAVQQVSQLEQNCAEFGIPLFDLESENQGIVHIIGPELGLTQPGMTIVCGDSHTATHGAFGALAFGIGTSEVAHVFATQCLLQEKPKSCQVNLEGTLKPGVTAKDVILALIAKIGVGGGTGHVFEYTGSAVRSMSMEERMTLCNMSIEGGARAGLVAPDEITYEYLARRKFVPRGSAWEEALQSWQSLPSDEGAVYDKTVHMEVSTLEPRITYGTNPGMGIPITGKVPIPGTFTHPDERALVEKALLYMGLTPGQAISGHPLDAVFIGSCTNGRISDLRQASQIMKGRKIAPGLRVLVVPGSNQVKLQAEAEGLDKIFKAAGAEWREPGCSLCLGMNGDILQPGQSAVSTSNRNFEGRQGKGARTFLASPYTAAASAIAGSIADPRPILTEMANR